MDRGVEESDRKREDWRGGLEGSCRGGDKRRKEPNPPPLAHVHKGSRYTSLAAVSLQLTDQSSIIVGRSIVHSVLPNFLGYD